MIRSRPVRILVAVLALGVAAAVCAGCELTPLPTLSAQAVIPDSWAAGSNPTLSLEMTQSTGWPSAHNAVCNVAFVTNFGQQVATLRLIESGADSGNLFNAFFRNDQLLPAGTYTLEPACLGDELSTTEAPLTVTVTAPGATTLPPTPAPAPVLTLAIASISPTSWGYQTATTVNVQLTPNETFDTSSATCTATMSKDGTSAPFPMAFASAPYNYSFNFGGPTGFTGPGSYNLVVACSTSAGSATSAPYSVTLT